MRIAITGATGFIGQWLIKEGKSDFEIVCIGLPEEKRRLKEHKEVEFYSTDYSVESLSKILINKIDGVIHLAAQRPSSKANDRSYSDYSINIKLAYNVFEACRECDVENIVFTSSISVYGNSMDLPFRENIIPRPNGLYGLAKLSIDNLADFYNRKYNMAIKSLRLAHVIGLGENEGFMFMSFINKAKNKEKLLVYGKGEGRREYIYVKDIVSAVFTAIKNENLKGIFNIGTGVNTSHAELAILINEVFNNQNNLEFLENKSEDKSVDIMENSKAKSILNWQNNFQIKEALFDMKQILV